MGKGGRGALRRSEGCAARNREAGRPGASGIAQQPDQTLAYEDALALADKTACPSVAAVAPEVSAAGQIVYQAQNANSRVYGVTPEYAQVRNSEMASGEFIDAAQLSGRSLVAVLGSDTATTLFGEQDPLGQTIRVNTIAFRVIGVLASKGGSGMGNQDNVALVPLTTAQARLGRDVVRAARR